MTKVAKGIYIYMIMLTDPPKEFQEQLQWGAEALKENVTISAAKVNMIIYIYIYIYILHSKGYLVSMQKHISLL